MNVTANASSGYLVSAASSTAGPQAATSRLNTPGTPTVASSATTAGAISSTFTSSSGTAPTSYTANACTDAAMTLSCATKASYTSGAQFTGLTAGSAYYVSLTAVPPAALRRGDLGDLGASTLATIQLTAADRRPSSPTAPSAGSINVDVHRPSNAPGGQTYTVKACTNAAMTTGCVTDAAFTSGADLTGLAFAAGLCGHQLLRHRDRERVERLPRVGDVERWPGPQADTSQLNAPGTPDGRLVGDHGRARSPRRSPRSTGHRAGQLHRDRVHQRGDDDGLRDPERATPRAPSSPGSTAGHATTS